MRFLLINRKKNFSSLCNQEIVDLEPVTGSDADLVRGLVQEHQQLTGSPVAERLLEDWNYSVKLFVKVWLVENFRYKNEDNVWPQFFRVFSKSGHPGKLDFNILHRKS